MLFAYKRMHSWEKENSRRIPLEGGGFIKHLGDVTKINGATIPKVDCITFGAPCQDLSVAGLRKGMHHKDRGDGETTRSGLFFESVRIIKEMREDDRKHGRPDYACRPRYAIYENVPGAFSSNGGKDFQAVLTEIVKIAESNAPDVPMPTGGRKWDKVGGLCDEMGRWSIAWRVHDAQHFGVPQRRKRISLLADFGGLTAPEIMFDPKYERTSEEGKPISLVSDTGAEPGQKVQPLSEGVSGNPEQSGTERKETTRTIGESTEGAGCYGLDHVMLSGGTTYQGRGYYEDVSGCLKTQPHGVYKEAGKCLNPWDVQSKHIQPEDGIAEALYAGECRYGGGESYCLQGNGIDRADTAGRNGRGWCKDVSYTLNTIDRPAVLALNDQGGSVMNVSEDVTGTLRAEEHGHQPIVYNGSQITSEINHSNPQPGDACHSLTTDRRNYLVEPTMIEMTSTKNTVVEDGISPTLTARMGTGGNQVNAVCMDVGFFQTHEDVAGTLLARQYKDPPITYQDKCGSLMASGYQKNGTQEAANDMCVANNVVRRLTPLECERLQGFPDGWTDIGDWIDSNGKKHKASDTPRYKALGNSIALPFWFWLLRRISAQYERPATLGSLFDGIGGFPLCWERCNGKGTAIWASEIEEFPIAVTKLRFPDSDYEDRSDRR